MVAIVSGSAAGLFSSSFSVLGQQGLQGDVWVYTEGSSLVEMHYAVVVKY